MTEVSVTAGARCYGAHVSTARFLWSVCGGCTRVHARPLWSASGHRVATNRAPRPPPQRTTVRVGRLDRGRAADARDRALVQVGAAPADPARSAEPCRPAPPPAAGDPGPRQLDGGSCTRGSDRMPTHEATVVAGELAA